MSIECARLGDSDDQDTGREGTKGTGIIVREGQKGRRPRRFGAALRVLFPGRWK